MAGAKCLVQNDQPSWLSGSCTRCT